MTLVAVPAWVEEAAARRRPRVPIGEVVSSCRWPVRLNAQVADGRETLAAIAAASYPLQCLACRSEHRIDALTSGLNPALERVACPTCGTVGLWPPNRPIKELEWANRDLWKAYGADLPLPEGQEVLVPQLCGHEVRQHSDRGPELTFCKRTVPGAAELAGSTAGKARPHVSEDVGKQQGNLRRHYAHASSAARPSLAVVREPGPVNEPAPVPTPTSPVEPLAGEFNADDPFEAVRAELEVSKRLLDDSAARLARAVEGFQALVANVAQDRADLQQRYRKAEADARAAREESERVTAEAAQRVADAESAQRRAEGRAQQLSDELGADRKAEVEQLVAATLDRLGSRRGAAAGERLTKPQRDMLLAIGNKQKRVDRAVAQQSWYVDGQLAGSGAVKTLNSLLQRQMINWGEDDGSGFSALHLVNVGVDYFRATTGRVPSSTVDDEGGVEVAGRSDLHEAQVGEIAVPAGRSDLDEAPAGEAAAPAGWKPEPGAIESLLHRVAAGGVSRGGNRAWLFAGGVTPPTPAIQHLDYMLERDLIAVGDGHPAVVYVVEGATSSR
ncbi:hypothetical protein ACIGO9_29585 [Nocardia asteroides]|uniref:hypothetical protein n=1 Tax=Nocardia asteroides TaxID=1824 RepID=UPI0037C8BB99